MKRIGLILLICFFPIATFPNEQSDQNTLEIKMINPQYLLREAIINDSPEEVEAAIQAGAIINFNEASKSPLLHALLSRSLKAARKLIAKGANPNIVYKGKKLSHYFLNNSAILILLIEGNADYSGTVGEQPDMLTYALHTNENVANALINKGNDIKPFIETKNLENNLWYQSLSNIDIHKKSIPPVKFFLQHKANVNQVFTKEDGTTWTPLLIAINNYIDNIDTNKGWNSQTIIRELLASGAQVNQKSNPIKEKGAQTPLSFLFLKNKDQNFYNFYEELTKKGANLTEALDLYLKSGGNPKANIKIPPHGYWSLLGLAIINQDAKSVKKLLNAGAISTSQNRLERSSEREILSKGLTQETFDNLSLALKLKNTEIIELLLESEQK